MKNYLLNFATNIPYIQDVYLTYDQGRSPYKVLINNDNIIIKDNYSSNEKIVCKFNDIKKIFIGTSPLTEITRSSKLFGKKFDGNTILIETEALTYVYIGESIYRFSTIFPIVFFLSEIGLNNQTYPYAIDKKNNVYLFKENIIINNDNKVKNPYKLFYDKKPELKVQKIDIKKIVS
jgi:hypothetical protein